VKPTRDNTAGDRTERAEARGSWAGGRRSRGAILILVLWALVVLVLLAGGISFTLKQDLAISSLQRDRLAAHWAARAGVERGIAALMDDANATDSEQDAWADDERIFKDVGIVGGFFNLYRDGYELQPLDWRGINDECAKLNVNTATREQLMRLPRMTAPVAAAILDWRDENQQPEPDGVERGHYESLPHPYTIRNGPLRSIRELLLVRGVTPELFYGEDANGNGRLDDNENDGPASDPPDNADGRLDRGWYAYLTVHSLEKNVDALGSPRVNIRTADAGTLTQRLRLEPWAAQSIVKYRGEHEFKRLVDLLKVPRDPNVKRGGPESDTFARSEGEKDVPVTKDIFKRLCDRITLTDDPVVPGRVNINTAPREVLAALTDDETADAILRERAVRGPFTGIGDILGVGGLTEEKFGEIDDRLAVRSSVFRIRSQGTSDSELATATIECVVDRGGAVPKVLYWLESSP
ncbi:MAG: general secretion pathway protein GspK, partial [Phycisphaerae bacterium]|jgi:type II secretory pathway component PulK